MILEISFSTTALSPFSLTLAVVGYVTVFIALVIMYLVYSNIPRLINMNIRRKLRKKGDMKTTADQLAVSGEVNAAIGMALYLALNEHDEESHTLTIRQIQRSYTPWSSRIYSVNDYFKLK